MKKVLQEKHEHQDCDDHKEKTVTVIVNGRKKEIPKREELTFDGLVLLAFDNPPQGKFICFTITYRKGHDKKPDGTVPEGGFIKPKEGMIFNVTATDKS